MPRKAVYITAILSVLSGVGAVVLLHGPASEAPPPGAHFQSAADPPQRMGWEAPVLPPRLKPVPGEPAMERELKNLRRELAAARGELEELSRPLHEDIASSTVSATVKDGESLVTGGYKTRDGNYELTFLTPRKVKLEDGREAVEIGARIVTLSQEAIAGTGLESMSTNVRNTMQHAEAWSQGEVENTLAAISEKAGQDVLSPKVTSALSEPFTIQVAGASGPAYSLEGTVGRDANGDWTIQSRIERDEKNQPPDTP